MKNLLEVADKQGSLSMTIAIFDENLFQQFMRKNPVWNFYAISRDNYLCKSKADKEQLLLKIKLVSNTFFIVFF